MVDNERDHHARSRALRPHGGAVPKQGRCRGSTGRIFADVEAARERHRIPEVMLLAGAHVEAAPATVRPLARGSSEWAEHLAAIGFRMFVGPLLARAKKLQEFAMGSEDDDE